MCKIINIINIEETEFYLHDSYVKKITERRKINSMICVYLISFALHVNKRSRVKNVADGE